MGESHGKGPILGPGRRPGKRSWERPRGMASSKILGRELPPKLAGPSQQLRSRSTSWTMSTVRQ